jgi:hypothetical protein
MPFFALKLVSFLRHCFGQVRTLLLPREDDPPSCRFSRDEIAGLYRVVAQAQEGALDEPTWNDLLLDSYGDALSGEVSLFGRQVLYRRLREGLDDAGRAAVRERLRQLTGDPAALGELHHALRPLRHADTDVASLLYEQTPPPVPRWAAYTWLLPQALLACVAAVALSPLAWLGVALVVYLLMSIQMGYHARIQLWQSQLRSLGMLLRVHSLMGMRDGPFRGQFAPSRELAGRISRSLPAGWASRLPGIGEYADWFLLANVKHYFRSAALVFGHRQFLRESYQLCANLEADVALARHLLVVPAWCWAERAGDRELVLEGVAHPLLVDAAPLSVALDGKGAFISGQNGVGKSTFLRAVGLNLVAARAFGFCYAQRARVPALPVYASMRNEDSLLGGESLYLAELRRARELLAAAQRPHRSVFLIDEMFRGTNHVESVSAAAAVLDVLAERGQVIVSSHNLVLAPLLAHRLEPYFVGRGGTGKLALCAGVLAQTNGVELLARHGFGEEVEMRAAKVSCWLGEYLASPAEGSTVLVPRQLAPERG